MSISFLYTLETDQILALWIFKKKNLSGRSIQNSIDFFMIFHTSLRFRRTVSLNIKRLACTLQVMYILMNLMTMFEVHMKNCGHTCCGMYSTVEHSRLYQLQTTSMLLRLFPTATAVTHWQKFFCDLYLRYK
jgi:hypothetical protein